MPHYLILGTAGHIDHGKTTLIKALTGIDCDRLPEEKARGITIDIGFAQFKLGDFHIGVVDVPGHERFIKNMLAGATGIDLALLVVAADDSVMPQTREHLDILKLLGIRQGVIALTKADLVDEISRQVAELEVRELVRDSFLEDAPIISTSSGVGIEELKNAILHVCSRIMTVDASTPFRLAIDRVFVVQGHGTVVTGTVASGVCHVGDEMEWHHGGHAERVRIRGLNNHNTHVDQVSRGQRAALNLAGVPHEAVHRGHELATPGYLVPSRILTVRLEVLANLSHGIKHRLPCRLHLGTAEVMTTLSLLDADRIEPGQSGLAQLFLDDSVTAVWGQHFVIRASSAEQTLGGGIVLQPVAAKIRRRQPEPLEKLEQLTSQDPPIRVSAAVWFQGTTGISADDLQREAALNIAAARTVIEGLVAASILVAKPDGRYVHRERVAEIADRIVQIVGTLHTQYPLRTTHAVNTIIGEFAYLHDDAFVEAVLHRLTAEKQLIGDERGVARADFKPRLSANQRKWKRQIVEEYHAAGFQPPDISKFIKLTGQEEVLGEILEVACADGELVRINSEIYLHADSEAKMRELLVFAMHENTAFTVAQIRVLLGTTRKYAVPICEYLDRIGFTRREGDSRLLTKKG